MRRADLLARLWAEGVGYADEVCQLDEGAEVSSALAAVLATAGDEMVVSGVSGTAGADVEVVSEAEGVDAGVGAVVVFTSGVLVATGSADVVDVALADGEEVAEVEALALGDALTSSDGFGDTGVCCPLFVVTASVRSSLCRVGLLLDDGWTGAV